MNWRQSAALIGLELPSWKAHVFDYLETNGFRFLVDFGTDNAIEKARAHWRSLKERKR